MLSLHLLAVAAIFSSTFATPSALESRQSSHPICSVKKTNGATCGQTGQFLNPSPLQSFDNVLRADCVYLLHNTTGARSAQYTASSESGGSECDLFEETAEAQGFIESPSGSYTFDKACLRCQSCDPNDVNIKNGGFDTGNLMPWKPIVDGSQNSIQLAQPGYDGSAYALNMTLGPRPRATSSYTQLQQFIRACPYTNYTVHVRYKSGQAPVDGSLLMLFSIGPIGSNRAEAAQDHFSGEWERLSLDWTSDSRSRPKVRLYAQSLDDDYSHSILFDSVTIVPRV